MELTPKELEVLNGILKVEIVECEDLLKVLDDNDKKEMTEYLASVKKINEKINS